MSDFMGEDVFVEGFDDGEDWVEWEGEGDLDDAESAYDARRRRARRELVAARQRRAARLRASRAWPAAATGPASRGGATAAIRQLDLERRVQGDTVERAFAVRDRRARRAEAATVAGVVVNQAQHSLAASSAFKDLLGNRIASGLLAAAPLLLLSPAPRGSGTGALIRDPRVVGFALVAGLLAFAEWEESKSRRPGEGTPASAK